MSINHTWSINSLKVLNNGTQTVSEVWYTVTSTNSSTGTTVSTEEFIELDVNNIQNFISYNSLTESTVIGWVKSKLGPFEGGHELNNSAQIATIDNPPTPSVVSTPLPW